VSLDTFNYWLLVSFNETDYFHLAADEVDQAAHTYYSLFDFYTTFDNHRIGIRLRADAANVETIITA